MATESFSLLGSAQPRAAVVVSTGLEVARRHGATAVWVFGSVARGDATPPSDVDFLVEFEPGRSLLDQVHLIDEFSAILGTRVDVVARGGPSSVTTTSLPRPSRCEETSLRFPVPADR
jgi:hypothetical protein